MKITKILSTALLFIFLSKANAIEISYKPENNENETYNQISSFKIEIIGIEKSNALSNRKQAERIIYSHYLPTWQKKLSIKSKHLMNDLFEKNCRQDLCLIKIVIITYDNSTWELPIAEVAPETLIIIHNEDNQFYTTTRN